MSEPTPEQVGAAAKAIADCHNPGMFEKYPENWRVEARAALVAAAGAAPVLPLSTVDEGDLAKVIHRAACGPECADDAPMRMDYRIARAVVEAIGGEGR